MSFTDLWPSFWFKQNQSDVFVFGVLSSYSLVEYKGYNMMIILFKFIAKWNGWAERRYRNQKTFENGSQRIRKFVDCSQEDMKRYCYCVTQQW